MKRIFHLIVLLAIYIVASGAVYASNTPINYTFEPVEAIVDGKTWQNEFIQPEAFKPLVPFGLKYSMYMNEETVKATVTLNDNTTWIFGDRGWAPILMYDRATDYYTFYTQQTPYGIGGTVGTDYQNYSPRTEWRPQSATRSDQPWRTLSGFSGSQVTSIPNTVLVAEKLPDGTYHLKGGLYLQKPVVDKKRVIILNSLNPKLWFSNVEAQDVNVKAYHYAGGEVTFRFIPPNDTTQLPIYKLSTTKNTPKTAVVKNKETIEIEWLSGGDLAVEINYGTMANTPEYPNPYDSDSNVNILSPNDNNMTVKPTATIKLEYKKNKLDFAAQVWVKRNDGIDHNLWMQHLTGHHSSAPLAMRVIEDKSTLFTEHKIIEIDMLLVANSSNEFVVSMKRGKDGKPLALRSVSIIQKAYKDDGTGKDEETQEGEYNGSIKPLPEEKPNILDPNNGTVIDSTKLPDISAMVNSLKGSVGAMAQIFGTFFGFLPTEIITLMSLGIGLVILLRIVGR